MQTIGHIITVTPILVPDPQMVGRWSTNASIPDLWQSLVAWNNPIQMSVYHDLRNNPFLISKGSFFGVSGYDTLGKTVGLYIPENNAPTYPVAIFNLNNPFEVALLNETIQKLCLHSDKILHISRVYEGKFLLSTFERQPKLIGGYYLGDEKTEGIESRDCRRSRCW